MILGFSTGVSYKLFPPASKKFLDICLDLGCNAIEFYPATKKELEKFISDFEIIKNTASRFEYVSIHSPGVEVSYKSDEATRNMLASCQKAYDAFGAQCFVVHPDKVEDWRIFDEFSFNVAIENLSHDVPFSTPAQLAPIFDRNPDSTMVLDVNHSYQTYGAPALTDELASAFKKKIFEVHLSGYKTLHDPLFETEQVDIIKSIPDTSLPIIIESACNSAEELKKEIDYIRRHL